MLGLAFQGQGQLDMAFDKFKQGAAYEDAGHGQPLQRSPSTSSASASSTRRESRVRASWPQVQSRSFKRPRPEACNRAKQMSETVILGGSGGGRTRTLQHPDARGHRGRRRVGEADARPLPGGEGTGQGRDGRRLPRARIPRSAASWRSRPWRCSQEFEPDELDEVKERFFREAETAGRLVHPNIVTIYDAGEEHDLAYIAMEFLKGKDLVPHTKNPTACCRCPTVMGCRSASAWPRRWTTRTQNERRAPRHQAGQHHVRARGRRR